MNCDFKKITQSDSLVFGVKPKLKWQSRVLSILVELRLSKQQWDVNFDFAVEAQPKWYLKVLFTFIELRLSKSSLFNKTTPKWLLRVLFVLVELWLSKKNIKRDSLNGAVKPKPKWKLRVPFCFIECTVWLNWNFQKQSQNYIWKFFALHCIAPFFKTKLMKPFTGFQILNETKQFFSCGFYVVILNIFAENSAQTKMWLFVYKAFPAS